MADLPPAARVVYDVHANTADFDTYAVVSAARTSPSSCDRASPELSSSSTPPAPGALLAAEIDLPAGEHLLRCDRVDFPPGGEAFLHTHQGPGIRCSCSAVPHRDARRAARLRARRAPGSRPGPIRSTPRRTATSRARSCACMVLPRALLGSPSIRYVRDEDRDAPESQRYTVFVDEPVEL